MRKFLLLFTFVLGVIACNTISDNPNTTEETASDELSTLEDEVMAIHDTAMAKMNTVSQLQKRLKDKWQTMEDSLPYRQAFDELQAAHDDMMDWMRNYEVPEDAPEDEIRTYLLEERRVVQAVDQSMEEAINEAQFLLKDSGAEMEMDDESGSMDHEGHQH